MTRGNTEHLSDRTLRRQLEFARQTRPALSVEESSRLDRICQRLADIEDFEREQVKVLGDLFSLLDDALSDRRARREVEDRHREATGPEPHLRLVRE
jgi:hypothetical protein